MAPSKKKAIFIGRTSADTGFSTYQQLAKKFNLTLDVFTNRPNAAELFPNYDFAFVSRYLAILEALAAGVPVFAHYNNQIKYDYLALAPFAKFIKIFKEPGEVNLNLQGLDLKSAQRWAKSQTWSKLASQYEGLWQK